MTVIEEVKRQLEEGEVSWQELRSYVRETHTRIEGGTHVNELTIRELILFYIYAMLLDEIVNKAVAEGKPDAK